MSWEIEIIGDSQALRALGHSLRDAEYLIQGKDGHFVLTGPVFSKFRHAESIRDYGEKVIQSLSGMARLLLGSEKKIFAGAVFEITENGGKNIFVTPDPVKRLRTACSLEAIGDQTRHGKSVGDPPANPMKLSEARGMIDDLLKKWVLDKEG